jgi:response regulator NasT
MLSADLSVLIIDENRIRASIIEDGVREAGHAHGQTIHDVSEVARAIAASPPDMIVIDLENPQARHARALLLAVARGATPHRHVRRSLRYAAIEKAVEAGVSAYVVDGLKKERVKPILDMAVSRFNAFSRLSRELEEARSALEERKIVDRAKSHPDAVARPLRAGGLCAAALDRHEPEPRIADIAQSLIMAASLLAP